MFKRMSILLRRAEETRDAFARKWERHGKLVSQLPLIQSYLQNHVVEEFTPGIGPDADGIVELRFNCPEDMTSAFSAPGAIAVKEDEPSFLGHGTGYALGNDSPSFASPQGAKLVVAIARSDEQLIETMLGHAASSRGFRAACRDDVKTILGRPEMKRGPQEVATFLHLLFENAATASDAGRDLASSAEGTDVASVFRVRTVTVIPQA